MQRTKPPFRADQVGSFLRPERLKEARARREKGEITAAQLRTVEDEEIKKLIKQQEDIGMQLATDGEFRRRSWFAGFVDAVAGLTHKSTEFNFMEEGEAKLSVPVPHAEAPIRRTGGIATAEFDGTKRHAHRPVKITLPAPSVIHFFRGPDGIDKSVYPDEAQYWDDLLRVYREEIADLGRRGCGYVQLDEVPIALLCDTKIQVRIAQWGWDWRKLLDRYVWALNQAIAARPAGMHIGVHLCRGNFRGHFIGSGGYEPVAEKLFNAVAADSYLMEYDSERAGDFAPLRHLPRNKGVVLGLVSSKEARLEPLDALKRRVEEAARFAPVERLAVSPQCGFGTTVGGAPMGEDDQKRKLELVGNLARAVWG